MSRFWFITYFVVLAAYALWSFSLTDPNLVLTSWQPYWQLQQWMWQVFFHNAQLMSGTYAFLMFFAVVAWYGLVRSLPGTLTMKQLVGMVMLLGLPLLFSYNALSHDVFNYIFNAKMVLVYNQDPHLSTATQFPEDTWTRFMHNTHTPAPYGYGWTMLSLIPYMLGLGKFTLTWLIFRATGYLALPFLLILLSKLAKELRLPFKLKDVALVFLHPLLLVEIISNSHNDLWMLIPAVASFWVLFALRKNISVAISLSMTLFILSASTKFATLLLLPLWAAAVWTVVGTGVKKDLPLTIRRFTDLCAHLMTANISFLASVALFLPLVTLRSQLFHPWYLVWSLIWLPMVKVRWWHAWVLSLSISSLFRYIPWMLAGGFSPEIIRQQQTITWLGAFLSFCIWMIWCFKPPQRKQHETA